jgi:hypothetical protein
VLQTEPGSSRPRRIGCPVNGRAPEDRVDDVPPVCRGLSIEDR